MRAALRDARCSKAIDAPEELPHASQIGDNDRGARKLPASDERYRFQPGFEDAVGTTSLDRQSLPEHELLVLVSPWRCPHIGIGRRGGAGNGRDETLRVTLVGDLGLRQGRHAEASEG